MDAKDKPPLLVIAGPTAVGKTALALKVASKVGGEIISADSAQVFRGLDVGSAKIRPHERQGIAHFGIDVVDPQSPYSVADFQAAARRTIDQIVGRNRLPIVVGGTGLWIRALVRGYRFPDDKTPPVRAQVAEWADTYGRAALRRWLRLVDYASFEAISPQDARRTARALEVFRATGQPIARTAPASAPYRTQYWVLTRPVAELHQRIHQRLEAMLADGFADEVLGLLHAGVPPRSQSLTALGYRQMVDWALGRTTAEERDRLIESATRHLAKRQMTWFRSEPQARFIDLSAWGEEGAADFIIQSAQSLGLPAKDLGADND